MFSDVSISITEMSSFFNEHVCFRFHLIIYMIKQNIQDGSELSILLDVQSTAVVIFWTWENQIHVGLLGWFMEARMKCVVFHFRHTLLLNSGIKWDENYHSDWKPGTASDVSFNCAHLDSMIILTNNKLHMSSELTKIIKYFNCNCLYLLLQFTIKLVILLLLFWVQTYLHMLKKRKIAKFNKLQFHLSLKITKSKYPWNMAHDFLQNMIIAKLSENKVVGIVHLHPFFSLFCE